MAEFELDDHSNSQSSQEDPDRDMANSHKGIVSVKTLFADVQKGVNTVLVGRTPVVLELAFTAFKVLSFSDIPTQ